MAIKKGPLETTMRKRCDLLHTRWSRRCPSYYKIHTHGFIRTDSAGIGVISALYIGRWNLIASLPELPRK